MPARITQLRRRDSIARHRAAEVRQAVLSLEGEAPAATAQLLVVLDRLTAAEKGWSFVMLSPEQNRLVVCWLLDHSRRPMVATRIWATMFCHLRMDTGEIAATRQQLAEAARCRPAEVSAIISELVQMGALSRHREGNTTTWFMNPKVGTCLTGLARERAQADAPPLRLVPTA